MAKSPANNAAQRVRKKVRKNVADGIAHVHASFNNTIDPGTQGRSGPRRDEPHRSPGDAGPGARRGHCQPR